jgi:hypothetical protein
MHQDGQTDYFTFVKSSQPESQIAHRHYRNDLHYFDASANAIIIEKIPS